jgi:hypothetical protein
LAVIDKIIQGIPIDAKTEGVDPVELENMQKMRGMALDAGANTPDLPDDVLRTLSGFSLPKIFSSTMASGMIHLSTPEVTKIILFKSYPNREVPEDVLSKAVATQNSVLQLLEEFPNIINNLQDSGALALGPEHVDESVMKTMAPFMEKRSGISEYLKRRFVPENWQTAAPKTMPLSITDPATGSRYMTTRGAAIGAHDEIAKRNLYKVMGGGLLLGGGYKLLSHALPQRFKFLRPLVGAGLGAFGLSQWPSMGPHYMTEQGIPIPTMTEMSKVSDARSLALPIIGTLGTMAALSHDYNSRLRSGIPIGYDELPLGRRVLDSLGGFVYEHPLLSAGIGIIGGHRLGQTKAMQTAGRWGAKAFNTVKPRVQEAHAALKNLVHGTKISSYVGVNSPKSTVILPEVDLDKVAEWLGWVVIEG